MKTNISEENVDMIKKQPYTILLLSRNISLFFMIFFSLHLMCSAWLDPHIIETCLGVDPCPLKTDYDIIIVLFFAPMLPIGFFSLLFTGMFWKSPSKIEYLSKQPIPKIMIDESES